ncbi:MAG: hypothetical protein JST43_04045 [Bacteroidetes bacterium]|nr:hypothetical protein [Bacteroidota bacterium]MBS1541118.1 hypothetical protein [Bacteroidota bacterium]
MKKINKVNGGIAIYYGISFLIGAIGGLIGIVVWLFKIFTGQIDFSWGMLIGLIIFTMASGAIGYSILRVGYEEIEK